MTDSYVIQIYRRDEADPDQLTGTVERVGDRQSQVFHSMQELWGFLSTGPRRPGPAPA